MTNPNRTSGFTLVELLVVISIIVILASLVVCSIHNAKRAGRSVVCKNNLKQMGVWLITFTGEKSEYPLFFNPVGQSGEPDHASTWQRSLRAVGGIPDIIPAGNAPNVFNCPSAMRPTDFAPNEGYDDYGYNSDGIVGNATDKSLGLGGTGENGQFLPAVKTSEVANPAEMLAIGDSFIGWGTFLVEGRYDAIGLRFSLSAREGETTRALRRHDKMGNYVFCDGHVDGIRLERIFFKAAILDARFWNRDNQPHLERLR